MGYRDILIRFDIESGCKWCRNAIRILQRRAGGSRGARGNRALGWGDYPRIPHGKVLVISPDYNAPRPGRKVGVLTHYHIFLLDKDAIKEDLK